MPIDNADYRFALDLAASWRQAVVLTHQRPDGDALASAHGCAWLLRQVGCDATVVLFDPVPPRYLRIFGDQPAEPWDTAAAQRIRKADGLLVADTAARAQVEPARAVLEEAAQRVIVLDHHRTRDLPCRLALVDESAAATACLVARWIEAAELWPLLTPAVATWLLTGIGTDTGWFRFASTQATTFRIAAALVERGARPATIYDAVYQQDSAARLRLLGCALTGMELIAGGRAAILTLTRDDMARCQADPADTEDIVNEPLRIGTVELTALLTEQPDGQIRVSLRSRNAIDVTHVARAWGGGGHAQAAGARLPGPLSHACELVRQALSRALEPA